MRFYLLIILFSVGIFFGSCEPYVKHVDVSTSIAVSTTVIIQPTVERNDSIASNEILIACTIVDSLTQEPITYARVRVAGTDTPGNVAYSDSSGICNILLPIVPRRNAETLMFVIEVLHDGAITQPLSAYNEDTEAIALLGVSDPMIYNVAYLGKINIGWNRLGSTLKCIIPLKMK